MANIQITLLLPEEFLAEIDTYVKEQNLKRAPYIKELLFSAWQNRDVLAMSSNNNFAMSKNVKNQEKNRDVLPAIFDWLKNNGTRCEEVLSQINGNLEKLSIALIDDKSSKSSETIIDDNQPSLSQSSVDNSSSEAAVEEKPEVNEDGIDKNTLAYLKSLHPTPKYDWSDD